MVFVLHLDKIRKNVGVDITNLSCRFVFQSKNLLKPFTVIKTNTHTHTHTHQSNHNKKRVFICFKCSLKCQINASGEQAEVFSQSSSTGLLSNKINTSYIDSSWSVPVLI